MTVEVSGSSPEQRLWLEVLKMAARDYYIKREDKSNWGAKASARRFVDGTNPQAMEWFNQVCQWAGTNPDTTRKAIREGIIAEKECRVCHEVRPIGDFYWQTQGNYKNRRTTCKYCQMDDQKRRRNDSLGDNGADSKGWPDEAD